MQLGNSTIFKFKSVSFFIRFLSTVIEINLTIIIGSSSSDDGEENGKKAIDFMGKTTTLYVTAAHLPLLNEYDVKRPILTFYEGRKHRTTVFIFFS